MIPLNPFRPTIEVNLVNFALAVYIALLAGIAAFPASVVYLAIHVN